MFEFMKARHVGPVTAAFAAACGLGALLHASAANATVFQGSILSAAAIDQATSDSDLSVQSLDDREQREVEEVINTIVENQPLLNFRMDFFGNMVSYIQVLPEERPEPFSDDAGPIEPMEPPELEVDVIHGDLTEEQATNDATDESSSANYRGAPSRTGKDDDQTDPSDEDNDGDPPPSSDDIGSVPVAGTLWLALIAMAGLFRTRARDTAIDDFG
ncbi:MAG: hypothetical protein AAGA91_01335 [Pseudomonadota bacterium]